MGPLPESRSVQDQIKKAMQGFEVQLSPLGLSKEQIETQTLPELEQSLERVNDALQHPEAFGIIRLKMTDEARLVVTTSSAEAHYEIGIVPVLLERKKLILDRIRLLKGEQKPENQKTPVQNAPPAGVHLKPAGERHVRPTSPAAPGSGLKAAYDNSWAVVIGINAYSNGIKPLTYAVRDADGFARLLIADLGFKKEQVFVVLDPAPDAADAPYTLAAQRATKEIIERLLEDELPERTGPDDRLLIFFAGHGERRILPSGEQVGYLLPADAQPGKWYTYIPTEDVTQAGNFCRAKHVFYLFDACYSGLAVTRAGIAPSPYEETMLTNRARMALTAGTAKEAVNDQGPGGHSPFTWYVIQGLRGEAAQQGSSVITGSDLMVYVKNEVGRNFGSQQTPDFGKLPGHESGGDFIFRLPAAKPVIDLSRWVTIRDLGPEPTAAAAGAVTAVETSLARRGQRVRLSIRALYDRAKQHDEIGSKEDGTWLTAVVYVAEQFGIPFEAAVAPAGEPPQPAGRRTRPAAAESPVVRARFFRLAGLDEIPEHLARGRPIVAGCRVYDKWFRDAGVAKTGVLLAPDRRDQMVGLNVVTIVRYDPNDGSLRVANNWGTGWGDSGFATMSAGVAQALLVQEMMWAVEAEPASAAPEAGTPR